MSMVIGIPSGLATILALIESGVAAFVINHVFAVALLAAPVAGALLPTPRARR